jgi:3-methyladenine DNA glycosylase/8-oxoguanine DNA glycosylase
VWQACETEAGAATLCIGKLGEDRLLARAWGPGAEEVLARVEALCGFHDDPGAIEPRHRLVGELKQEHPGLRLGRGRSPIDVLVATILGQRVTTEEAHESYRRMAYEHGRPAPGPLELRTPPDPRALAALSLPGFHRFGVEGSRARTLVEVCRHPRYVARIAEMKPEEAVEHLCKLPGVGPWTAHITVGSALGWPDAVPTGDYHLPSAVAWALAGEARADDARMLELLEPYRGQRWRLLRLLGAGHVEAPRFGARRAPFREHVALASARNARAQSSLGQRRRRGW